MLHIVLLRPGTTDFDDQGRIQGTLDIPLNAHGREQIEQVAAELPCAAPDQTVAAIYVAPSQASQESAALLTGHLPALAKKKPKTVRKLHNIDLGLWQGKLIDEVRSTQRKVYRKWLEDPLSVAPPEGESVEQACQRVAAAVEKIVKRHRTGTVLVITPEPIASLIQAELTGVSLAACWSAESQPARYDRIEVQPQSGAASV